MKKKTIGIATVLFLLAAVCLAVHFTVNPTIVREVSDDAAVKIAQSWLDKQISLRDCEVTEAHFFTFEDAQTKHSVCNDSVNKKAPHPEASGCGANRFTVSA